MNRPKTSGKDLPQKMLRRVRTLASGARWEGYYYDGRDDAGKRKEIPLGTDLNEAKRKWAELECRPAPVETGIMRIVFDRYAAKSSQPKHQRHKPVISWSWRNSDRCSIPPQSMPSHRSTLHSIAIPE